MCCTDRALVGPKTWRRVGVDTQYFLRCSIELHSFELPPCTSDTPQTTTADVQYK